MDGLTVSVVRYARFPIRVNEATLVFINERRVCSVKDKRNGRFPWKILQLTFTISSGGQLEKLCYMHHTVYNSCTNT